MAQITPQQAAEFLARWQQVNRHELAELRGMHFEQKFRQLCALAASRQSFPTDPDRDRRAAEVAARWQLIRAHYGD